MSEKPKDLLGEFLTGVVRDCVEGAPPTTPTSDGQEKDRGCSKCGRPYRFREELEIKVCAVCVIDCKRAPCTCGQHLAPESAPTEGTMKVEDLRAEIAMLKAALKKAQEPRECHSCEAMV